MPDLAPGLCRVAKCHHRREWRKTGHFCNPPNPTRHNPSVGIMPSTQRGVGGANVWPRIHGGEARRQGIRPGTDWRRFKGGKPRLVGVIRPGTDWRRLVGEAIESGDLMSPDMGAALCPKDAPGLQRQAWGSADARDQLRRASSSTVLNVAEACGKTGADRRRFFLIDRGSACEAAAAVGGPRIWWAQMMVSTAPDRYDAK